VHWVLRTQAALQSSTVVAVWTARPNSTFVSGCIVHVAQPTSYTMYWWCIGTRTPQSSAKAAELTKFLQLDLFRS